MQEPPALRADRYRSRAEELRSCAAAWLDDEARAMLERIAKDYDRMAEHLDGADDAFIETAEAP